MRTLNDLAVSRKNAGDTTARLRTLDKMSDWLTEYEPTYLNKKAFKREAEAVTTGSVLDGN